jgi:hypothetical protein
MHKVLREVGVEHFALMRFAHTGEPLDKWVIGYRAPPQWIEAYRHRDDPNADPIVKHSRETVEPFFWSDVIDARARGRREACTSLKASSFRCLGLTAA